MKLRQKRKVDIDFNFWDIQTSIDDQTGFILPGQHQPKQQQYSRVCE